MKGSSTAGHLACLLTIIIWGTTFISTKILLVDFQPVEILFSRFVMGLTALIWACYSVLTKKISGYGSHTILTTRRIFCYGILFMIPPLFLFDFKLELARFANPVYLFNIIFLGLGASVVILHEKITALAAVGTVLTLAGLFLSEGKGFLKKGEKQNGLAK